MKKKIDPKLMIPIMLAILAVIIVLKLIGIGPFNSGIRLGFAGSAGLHDFKASYLKISGTFSDTLFASDGSSSVHGEIETESGSLSVRISDISGETVFFEKEISGSESFDVPAEGRVRITLKTEAHSGKYLFTY
ncbi:MAG: hypothetical protein K6E50_01510 [Lachnospiraceae bacterium]|nr:hypothetical protein [Lachnospiraceae bacterium]